MRQQCLRGSGWSVAISLAAWFCAGSLPAQETATSGGSPAEILTASQWEEVNLSVDRALQWLASQQQPDGSFPTLPQGQPGVTGLGTLAFLAQGHLPGEGPYGSQLEKALDYLAACQKRNGLLALVVPDSATIPRNVDWKISVPAAYSHAIAGLVLSESYAMSSAETSQRIQPVIEQALEASFRIHDWPKDRPVDRGGWRYLHDKDEVDSDLSITGWQLMFLRSAKNAGFEVEEQRIARAIGYVRKCYDEGQQTFVYKLTDVNRREQTSRGMAGAGILALAHAGLHHTREAQGAGDWILKSGFQNYSDPGRISNRSERGDRYFYGLLTCSQAMYQLGGRHWREFFPTTAAVLLKHQSPDGSWGYENHHQDKKWGNVYTTAVGVIALSAPNQLLPIFQR